MRATIPLRVALAKWASVSFTGRPTARATIASASLRLISRPPPKGSTTTSPPSTGAVTTKCAGRPTPSIASPTRRPTSIVTTESVIRVTSRRVSRAPELLRELERASRRPRRGGLRLGRRREAQEERAAELVVVALVRLDHVAVQRRGLRVAGRLAEPDELAVLDDRDRLARELAGRHALHGGRELVEVLEERAPALGQRVERPRVPAERAQPLRDHPIVLGLVANLPGERELHVHRVGRHEPAGRDLGGLELVPERDPEEVRNIQVALHLGPKRVVRRQAAQEALVLGVELGDELLGRHDPIPPCRTPASSCLSVSLVRTRRQRACHGCVSRARACVVKPRTGTRATSAVSRMRS